MAAMALCLLSCSGGDPETVDSGDDGAAEEPPYFVVDDGASGPLTLKELDIHIPSDIARHWSDGKKACFFDAVERRAAEAGDPETLDPETMPYWDGRVDAAQWEQFTSHMRRVLLAQAVLNWATTDC